MNTDIALALRDGNGLLRAHDHRALRGAISRAVAAGALTRLLPGVYCATSRREDLALRIRAVRLWEPDAVVVGAAAAWATFWPELRVPRIEVASTRRLSAPAGFVVRRWRVPDELVVEDGSIRVSSPALTTIDLAATLGGEAIDCCLRTRSASLADLHAALDLTRHRRGNTARRSLLLDSRDEPWSEAERALHRLLRDAGITGWRTNHEVRLAGTVRYLDVAFPQLLLAIEVDGREFHSSAEAFERDRRRQNQLVLAGWTVLRLTWSMLADTPEEVLEVIRAGIALVSGPAPLR